MSWTYLAVAESSGAPSMRACLNPAACEHGPPSIASSPTTPPPCSCRACSGARLTPHPSSATSARSKSRRGGRSTGPSSAAGPARATAWQALERAWRTSAAALLSKSSDWSVYFDQSSSSWRTSQASLLHPETGLDTSTPSWPASGMSYDGRIYQLPTLGKLTSAGGIGLWPSAAVANANGGQLNAPGTSSTGKRRGRADTTDSQAKLWATTRANDFKSGQMDEPQQDALNGQAVLWQRTGSQQPHQAAKITQPGNRSLLYSSMLNPRFAEWLLGWRIGLTELESLATAWISEQRKRRAKRSSKESDQ